MNKQTQVKIFIINFICSNCKKIIVKTVVENSEDDSKIIDFNEKYKCICSNCKRFLNLNDVLTCEETCEEIYEEKKEVGKNNE